MTRVAFVIEVGEGMRLTIDRDLDMFGVTLGDWLVEVIGGQLIVRKPNRPVNETPLLKVPA